MGLTSQEEKRRKKLENAGYTGRTSSELDRLNRAKTGSMSDEELFARVKSGKPSAQARAALRQRGHDV